MEITTFGDPVAFLESAALAFAHDPISTNVIATVTETIDPTEATTGQPEWWALVTEDDQPRGAAMLNPPWNLFLSAMPPGAAASIADTLTALGTRLPGVSGAAAPLREFVECWSATNSTRARLAGRRRVYVLDTLVELDSIDGQARLFRADEAPVAAKWWGLFHDEATPEDPLLDWLEVVEAHIARRALWCWCIDQTPVALAGVHISGALARIGPVFTPPDLRCNGFAAGVTAAAVRAGLDAGATHVMLYADVENATSNALYQRLGFGFDHDAAQYEFA